MHPLRPASPRPSTSVLETSFTATAAVPGAQVDVVLPPSSVLDQHAYCDVDDETEFATRMTVRETLDTTLMVGSPQLDLSFASVDAVSAIPGAALHSLAQQITSVVLPAALRNIPSCLHGLSALKEIDLPAFAGSILNVTQWNLDLLRLPGAEALRTVHASEGTVVQCPLSGIGRKVCVHYYQDGERMRSGAAGSRVYWKHPTLAHVNYNGRLFMESGKQAVCRHLAAWRGIAGRTRETIKSAGEPDRTEGLYEILQHCRQQGIPLAGDWDHTWRTMRTERRTLMVGNDFFGRLIADELQALSAAHDGRARAFYLMETASHAMLLELVCKDGGQFSVALYDPNVSLTHARIRLHTPQDMARVRIEKLLATGSDADYFKGMPPVILLFSLEVPREKGAPSAEVYLSDAEITSPLPLLLSTAANFTGLSEALFDHLVARSSRENGLEADAPAAPDIDWDAVFGPFSKNNSLIHHVIQAGNVKVLRIYLTFFIGRCAVDKASFSILPPLLCTAYTKSNGEQRTLMHLLVSDVYCPLLEVLANALLSDQAARFVSSSVLRRILTAAGSGLPSPLRTAIAGKEHRAIGVFSATVARFHQAGRLTTQSLERVLLDLDSQGRPALASIFDSRLPALLHEALSPWTGIRTLDPTTARRLFGGLDAQGHPVMRAFYASGDISMLRAYAAVLVQAIRGGALNAMEAMHRLLACTPEETLEDRLTCDAAPPDQRVPGRKHISLQIMLRTILSEPAFAQNLRDETTRAQLRAALDLRFDATESTWSDAQSGGDSLASDTESDDSGLSGSED